MRFGVIHEEVDHIDDRVGIVGFARLRHSCALVEHHQIEVGPVIARLSQCWAQVMVEELPFDGHVVEAHDIRPLMEGLIEDCHSPHIYAIAFVFRDKPVTN